MINSTEINTGIQPPSGLISLYLALPRQHEVVSASPLRSRRYNPRKLTRQAGKPIMNEDISPIKKQLGDFH